MGVVFALADLAFWFWLVPLTLSAWFMRYA